MRPAPLSAFAAALLATAALAPAAEARAQIAGVPTAPRVRRPPRGADSTAVSPDSATRAGRTSAQTVEQERTRLDIQAWVDSAAGALARSAPPPIPPPGAGGRPSIFSTPAVPDSLRPPPVGTPGTPDAARTTRPRRARSAARPPR